MSLWPSGQQWKNWSLPSKLGAIGTLLAAISLVGYGLEKAFQLKDLIFGDRSRVSLRLPEFRMTTTPVELPGKNEKPLSFSNIQNRRLHILEVRNPNKIPLSNIQLWTQFPEAILSVKSGEASASYTVVSAENWEKQPLTIEGDVTDSSSVEPFASEENTGLWQVTVNTVPAHSTIKIEFVTATGTEGGLYTEEVTKAQAQKADNELIWLIYGSYQFTTGSEAVKEEIVVPLEFDTKNRALRTLPVFRGTLKETDWVQMRQGRGVRIPGILSTRGYLLIKSRKGMAYIPLFRLERTDDIVVRFGLFGSPPTKPGIYIQWKQRNRKGNGSN